MNVLFVCTGNTCRSPMAEALLRYKQPNWAVKSAGIFASNGSQASQFSIQVLEEKGIEIDHFSRGVTDDLVNWADVILTMTENHKQMLNAQFPSVTHKTHLLKQVTIGKNEDVLDPFGGTLNHYRQTLEELEVLIDKLIRTLPSS